MKAGNRVEDIAQAEATLVEQQATLQNATQTLDRAQSLLNTAAGTIKSYDDAMGAQREAAARVNVARAALDAMKAGFRVEDIDAAAAQLAAQQAQVKTSERQLLDTSLVAPSDGIVQSRAQEVGAIVGVGAPVFVLSLTKPVWIRTYVSEPGPAARTTRHGGRGDARQPGRLAAQGPRRLHFDRGRVHAEDRRDAGTAHSARLSAARRRRRSRRRAAAGHAGQRQAA